MTNYEKWKAEQPAIERLLEEIQRLAKVYAGNQIALGVLQDIQNWAIEETVEPVEQNDPFEPCCAIQQAWGKYIHSVQYLPACQGATLPKTLMSARADSTTSGQLAPSVISVYHTPKTVKGLLFSQAKKVAAPPLTVFQGGVIRSQHRRAICSRGFEPPLGAVAKASGGNPSVEGN